MYKIIGKTTVSLAFTVSLCFVSYQHENELIRTIGIGTGGYIGGLVSHHIFRRRRSQSHSQMPKSLPKTNQQEIKLDGSLEDINKKYAEKYGEA